jgi:hypothetical protein
MTATPTDQTAAALGLPLTRYKVTVPATLVFEVDAPSRDAAQGAIYTAFKFERGEDPLAGTRFYFDSTERQCANPKLMTTVINERLAMETEEA